MLIRFENLKQNEKIKRRKIRGYKKAGNKWRR